MKIVIDIPDEVKEAFDNANIADVDCYVNDYDLLLGKAIKNCTPLPKGHDFVTKEQMIELVEFYQIYSQHFNFVDLIDEIKNEKPIIKKY